METCGEAFAVLSAWGPGSFSEHPASRIVPSMKASEAEIAVDLDFNVAEPPVGARGA
jgi:hypothetical protein